MSSRPSTRLSHAALITACVLWGGSFYFGKVALATLSAHHVVLWRFVLALCILLPISWHRARAYHRAQRSSGAGADDSAAVSDGQASGPGALRRLPAREDWPLFLLNAALMVPIQFILQFEGLDRTTASSAALIVGGFAPLLAVAALIVDREQPGRAGWAAIATSTLGLVLLVGSPGEGRSLVGDLMVLVSLVAAVSMVLCTRRLVHRYDSLLVTVISMGIGTLLLLPWTLISAGLPPVDLPAEVWGALVGLGVGCTAITFSLWNWGIRYVRAAHAGIYVNLEPFIGAVLGVVLLGDVLTPKIILGGGLILASAAIISLPTRPRESFSPDTLHRSGTIRGSIRQSEGTIESATSVHPDQHPN